MKTFSEWLTENQDTLFRINIYRRMFTPKENSEKYSDETFFESDYCRLVRIKDAVVLPDNDILFAMEEVFDDEDEIKYSENIIYVKLSEIRLFEYKSDQFKF